MNHRELLHKGTVHSEHIVHFFDDDRSRVEVVSSFLADALAANRSVLVVARPRYWTAVSERLRRQAVAVGPDTRLVVLDAHATLASIMRDGLVSPQQFNATVAPLVRNLAVASPAGLSAYGEMVDILAAEGDLAGAQALECCWNDLAAQESFTILCGYASAHFAVKGCRDAMAAICGAHTTVRTDSADALGQWLVRSAVP